VRLGRVEGLYRSRWQSRTTREYRPRWDPLNQGGMMMGSSIHGQHGVAMYRRLSEGSERSMTMGGR